MIARQGSRRARDLHRPQAVVRRRRRADLPGALAEDRAARGRRARRRAPGEALLPARPGRQARPSRRAALGDRGRPRARRRGRASRTRSTPRASPRRRPRTCRRRRPRPRRREAGGGRGRGGRGRPRRRPTRSSRARARTPRRRGGRARAPRRPRRPSLRRPRPRRRRGSRRTPRKTGPDPEADRPGAAALVELVVIVALAIGLALAIQAFLVKPYQIPSQSMEPTLDVGQRVLVNRFLYHFTRPRRSATSSSSTRRPAPSSGNQCGVEPHAARPGLPGADRRRVRDRTSSSGSSPGPATRCAIENGHPGRQRGREDRRALHPPLRRRRRLRLARSRSPFHPTTTS